ncbi:MAG: adenylosuccinate synthase, partial [Chloroflexota bacterium]
ISSSAHIITPAHLALDAAQEALRGKEQIGTTLRGIGPAYVDKSARRGLRTGDMLDAENFADKIIAHIEFANQQLTSLYQAEPVDAQKAAATYSAYARQLSPYIAETGNIISQALQDNQVVLAEGAQGTLLDLDHGTYPFVTSSNPTAAGAILGLGIGVNAVDKVIGVTKAFQTRVGEGALPTEVVGATAERLRGSGSNPWDEFGTTTGRPRRVGWLDLILLGYAVRVNGFTHLAITKLDILTGIDPIKICVGYKLGDQIHQDLPFGLHELEKFTPQYEEIPGWQIDVQSARSWDDLPAEAQNYLRRIEEVCGVKIGWASVGPERDQIAVLV